MFHQKKKSLSLPPNARRIAWSISSFVSPQLSPCFLSSSTSLRRNIPVTLSMAISCRITTLLSLARQNTGMNSFPSVCCPFLKALTCLRLSKNSTAVRGRVLAIKISCQKMLLFVSNNRFKPNKLYFGSFPLIFDLFIYAAQ